MLENPQNQPQQPVDETTEEQQRIQELGTKIAHGEETDADLEELRRLVPDEE